MTFTTLTQRLAIATGAIAAASFVAAAPAQAAALTTGDLAFTAFNADEDGWSIATFVDIDPNTIVRFSDGTAANATTLGTGESAFNWNTGANTITAGTVIRFSAIDTTSRASSVGTFTATNTANVGLSASDETIYAFLGSSDTLIGTILTAVSNDSNNTSLTTVGLTAGTNAIKLTSSADFAGYTGTRSGASSMLSYAALVNNPANWAIDVGGVGTSVTPNTTNFTTAEAVPTPALLPALIGFGASIVRKRKQETV